MNNFGIEPCFSCENPLDPNSDCDSCYGTGRGDLSDSETLFLMGHTGRGHSYKLYDGDIISDLTDNEIEFLEEEEHGNPCENCEGSGEKNGEVCDECNGSGKGFFNYWDAQFYLDIKRDEDKNFFNSIKYK